MIFSCKKKNDFETIIKSIKISQLIIATQVPTMHIEVLNIRQLTHMPLERNFSYENQ